MKTNEHEHVDSRGIVHKCYHECKTTFREWGFWIGVTVSFPLEHALYTHVWPFTIVGRLFGLDTH